MSRIAVIDADLIGRKKHRFPNLACMKLSGYHKLRGDTVVLKTDYDDLETFDQVYLVKVFTDTPVPKALLHLDNVQCGGTGFYYDKAPPLPAAIEHHRPDYHLYDSWVADSFRSGGKEKDYTYYRDYSIGFLTRGCFRKCSFCVNQNYDRVERNSPLIEFLDVARKKICLLDDNFFGQPDWKEMLIELRQTKKPFQFKQGLDERLLDEDKCELLFSSKYEGDYIFAFDHWADHELIEQKIQLAHHYTKAVLKFYCFCGFDRKEKWDTNFWVKDIFELFYRIKLLMRNQCLPYIMRFEKYKESPFRGVYISIARWCNQPSFFKKKSLREFAQLNGEKSACYRYLQQFELQYPTAGYFYDLKYENPLG